MYVERFTRNVTAVQPSAWYNFREKWGILAYVEFASSAQRHPFCMMSVFAADNTSHDAQGTKASPPIQNRR